MSRAKARFGPSGAKTDVLALMDSGLDIDATNPFTVPSKANVFEIREEERRKEAEVGHCPGIT